MAEQGLVNAKSAVVKAFWSNRVWTCIFEASRRHRAFNLVALSPIGWQYLRAILRTFYNPLHFSIDFSPDVSTVFTTGVSNTAAAPKVNVARNKPPQLLQAPVPASLPQAFNQIESSYQALHSILHQLDIKYSQHLDAVKQSISDITNVLGQVDRASPANMAATIKNLYKSTLQASLTSGIAVQTDYLPSDRTDPNDPRDISLLEALRYAKDNVDFIPQQYVTGDSNVKSTDFECSSNTPPTKKPGWVDWYTKCKPAYDSLETEITNDIATAQLYSSQSDKVTTLRKSLAILLFWDKTFSGMGLTTSADSTQIDNLSLNSFLSKTMPQPCFHSFNKTETSTVAISYVDLTPALTGSALATGKTDPFATITCTTPFSLSGGVGFSLIANPEFAIVKSAGGANNTSINKFGILSNSKPHPMPLAIAHVRLHSWFDNLLAAHGSVGVAGNIQGQDSGGSSAEFLLGGSVSVWRTMYLTLGLHIGAEPTLAGGFHVGDTVPSDVTSVQVNKSYTTGFGFAISFTKP